MGDDCLFCKIASGALNTEFLHETGNLVVFRDIHPKAPVHLLLVPSVEAWQEPRGLLELLRRREAP